MAKRNWLDDRPYYFANVFITYQANQEKLKSKTLTDAITIFGSEGISSIMTSIVVYSVLVYPG